jgi:hypothetical protein
MNRYCEQCNVVVKKTEWDAHMAAAHAIVQCKACNGSYEAYQSELHATTQCAERAIRCEVCVDP